MPKIPTNINQDFLGRGTNKQPNNKFHKLQIIDIESNTQTQEPKDCQNIKTHSIEVIAKTMINEVLSPDVPMEYSVNPYQGCEHGCIYCYARQSHNYWGFSSGLDFESTILVKKNALQVLKSEIESKKYKLKTIFLSGNTDCYQPLERKYKLTRQILDLLLKYKHPVSIITKNALVLRDLDILEALQKDQLCSVAISLTSLDDRIRRALEPRASSVITRLKTIEILSRAGIPVHVLFAPIIPGINDQEIFEMVKASREAGAQSCSYQIIRLNGDVELLFSDWLQRYMPERKDKVLNAIQSCHGGNVSDSRFGTRMKGEGKIADIIRQQFTIAQKIFFKEVPKTTLNHGLFYENRPGQLRLF